MGTLDGVWMVREEDEDALAMSNLLIEGEYPVPGAHSAYWLSEKLSQMVMPMVKIT
jgi:hypothetical protein